MPRYSNNSYTLVTIGLILPPVTTVLEKLSAISSQKRSVFGVTPTEKQFNESFLDPQANFLGADIKLGGNLIALRRQIDQQQLHHTDQLLLIKDARDQVQDKIKQLDMTGQTIHTATKQAEEKLRMQERKVEENLAKDRVFEAQTSDLFSNVNQAIEKHDRQWQQHRLDFAEKLITTLETSDVPLSELEKEEIRRCDTVTEIIRRYKDIGLTLPIAEEKIHEKNSHYFLLMAKYAIYNSLARRMAGSGEDIITRLLAKIVPFLDQVDKDSKQLKNQQKADHLEIRQHIAQITKSLHQLKNETKQIDKTIETTLQMASLTLSQQAAEDRAAAVEEIEYKRALADQGIHYGSTTISTKH